MLSVLQIGILAGASSTTVLLYKADEVGMKQPIYICIWLLAGIKILLLTGNQKVLHFQITVSCFCTLMNLNSSTLPLQMVSNRLNLLAHIFSSEKQIKHLTFVLTALKLTLTLWSYFGKLNGYINYGYCINGE